MYQCHALRAETTGFMVGGRRRGGLERTRDRWVGCRCGVGSSDDAEDLLAWRGGSALMGRGRVWVMSLGVSGG